MLEPQIAGLAIAYSTGAPWIACLTIGAFLTRQPLKVLLADRFGMRNRERASLAFRFLLCYGAIFSVGLAGTLLTVGFRPLLPFTWVLPLALFQIYIDASGQSRKLIPELTGAVVMSARSQRSACQQYVARECYRTLGDLCIKVNCLYSVCS
ncbi:MAG: YwiC-like family protein [Acidobacteria bacterium]|nr:YwiC-like family protein [Acidobacteriota bacterium]